MTEQPPTLRELLELRLDQQDNALAEILAEVKETNGRVRGAEVKIAALQVGFVVGGAWLAWWLSKLP